MPFAKLARDKIPEIVKAKGIHSVNHIANDKDFENDLG